MNSEAHAAFKQTIEQRMYFNTKQLERIKL